MSAEPTTGCSCGVVRQDCGACGLRVERALVNDRGPYIVPVKKSLEPGDPLVYDFEIIDMEEIS